MKVTTLTPKVVKVLGQRNLGEICSQPIKCDCDYLSFVNTFNECQLCSSRLDNCVSCNQDGSACTRCWNGYYVNATGECTQESCRLKDSYGKCIECNHNTDMILYKEEQKCVEICSEGYRLERGICVKTCPMNSYLEGNICWECSWNCVECSAEGICLACEPGRICNLTCEHIHDYLMTGRCLNSCPIGSYVSYDRVAGYKTPYCKPCSTGCLRCNDQKCLQCEPSYSLRMGTCESV